MPNLFEIQTIVFAWMVFITAVVVAYLVCKAIRHLRQTSKGAESTWEKVLFTILFFAIIVSLFALFERPFDLMREDCRLDVDC